MQQRSSPPHSPTMSLELEVASCSPSSLKESGGESAPSKFLDKTNHTRNQSQCGKRRAPASAPNTINT